MALSRIEFAQVFVCRDQIPRFWVRLDQADKKLTSTPGLRLSTMAHEGERFDAEVLRATERPRATQSLLEILLRASAPVGTPKPLVGHGPASLCQRRGDPASECLYEHWRNQESSGWEGLDETIGEADAAGVRQHLVSHWRGWLLIGRVGVVVN